MRTTELLTRYSVCGLLALLCSGNPIDAQQSTALNLSFTVARPLEAVIRELENRYGWIITFEDPPYEAAADLEDITLEAVKDLNTKAKVIAPRRRHFEFHQSRVDASRPEEVLSVLIRDYNDSGNGDEFELRRTGAVFHVVPTVSSDAIGIRTSRQSRLDVRVTVPQGERSVMALLQMIIAQVREQTGVHVTLGIVPQNALAQKTVRFSATNERAQDVLVRALATMEANLSWRLQCDPGSTKFCFFSIHPVLTPK